MTIAGRPPGPLPTAADPATGHTSRRSPRGLPVRYGLAHPEYSNFTDLDNWNDVGVVVLDQPATGIAPALWRR